jgi:hypothetical protein
MDKACSQIFSGPELVRHENVDTHKGEGTTQCWGSTASKLRSRAQDRLRIVGSGLTIFTERLWIVCSVGPAYKLKAKVRILFEMLRLKPWSLYPLRIVHCTLTLSTARFQIQRFARPVLRMCVLAGAWRVPASHVHSPSKTGRFASQIRDL